MVGALEDLASQIARGRIAPERLLGGAREALAAAFGARQQACERQIESTGKTDEDDGGGARLAAFDLADGGARDAGTLGQIRERPAARFPLLADGAGEPRFRAIHNRRHKSMIVDSFGPTQQALDAIVSRQYM